MARTSPPESELANETQSPGSAKAARIRNILQRYIAFEGCDLLDIGTGSGETAAGLQALGATVTAIDRQDNGLRADGLDFRLVEGTDLPFGDAAFDAVLYTRVIEHVGGLGDQRNHLSEIRRVLRNSGVLYLAVPNRWSVFEPHYKLPLLSWFPARIASAYLQMTGRGEIYDCLPHSRKSLRSLFEESGFQGEEVTGEVLDAVLREPLRNLLAQGISLILARLRFLSLPLIPVLVFVARPR